MLSSFLIGSASTYGLYRGCKYFLTSPSGPTFEEFLRFEDVRSTIITVKKYLKKNEDKEQLKKQLKKITYLLHELDTLKEWRQAKYFRYFAYTGEQKLINDFKVEWMIFKHRIRVISGLNYLDYIG